MAIRADSYGTVDEVAAIARSLLRGRSTFNATTTPTVTEVEKFIDRASAKLNVALQNKGLSIPISNSTAKLDCDDWVVVKAAQFAELTLRGSGQRQPDGTSRFDFLAGLAGDAAEFVEEQRLGWIRLGVGVGAPLSQGVQNTAETIQKDRVDPDNKSLEQPKFKRGQWDN